MCVSRFSGGRLLHVASSTAFPAGVRLVTLTPAALCVLSSCTGPPTVRQALEAKCDVDGVDEDDNTPLTVPPSFHTILRIAAFLLPGACAERSPGK